MRSGSDVRASVTGKAVLITGATGAIGAALAEAFAAEGAVLHLVARSGDALDRLAARLRRDHGARVTTQAIDLSVSGASQAVLDRSGPVDILINNAGAIPGGDLWAVDETAWRAAWELKVLGYINLVRSFYPRLKEAGGGVIVNVIGAAGEILDPNYICGATGNAALMAFTRAIGARSLDDGIRVVGVNPGPVDTPRLRDVLRGRGAAGDPATAFARYPGGRPAAIDEVVATVLFLSLPAAGYISGTIVTVDGGLSARGTL